MMPPGAKSLAAPLCADGRIRLIDYIRMVAILLVLGFHLLIESFGHREFLEARLSFSDGNPRHFFLALLPFSYGFMGVAVFFCISGFCIHLNHARSKRQEYKVFFIRRFFRIYPSYFLALCFFSFLFPFTMLRPFAHHNIIEFASHALMVHNLNPRTFYGINGSFWSIAVEMQLYAIYPLLLLLVRRFGWNKALFITGVIEMSIRGFPTLPFWISGSPFGTWFSWSIGAKLADDYVNRRPLSLAKCPLWVWPCITAITYAVKPLFAYHFPCVALATATTVAYFMSRPPVRVPLPRILSETLCKIGLISYSVYLLHGPLLAFLPHKIRAVFPAHHFSPFEIGVCLLFFSLILLLGSGLFYRFVELTSIDHGNWFLKRISPLSAPVPTQELVNS